MGPKVERLEEKYRVRVRFVSLNIDKALPLADRYRIIYSY
jgi:hypothetical protein